MKTRRNRCCSLNVRPQKCWRSPEPTCQDAVSRANPGRHLWPKLCPLRDRGLASIDRAGDRESTRQVGYEFRLILKPIDMTEELANKLHATGGTPGTFCGVPFVRFHREAENLETAIRSAVSDARKAGCVVECREVDFSGGK